MSYTQQCENSTDKFANQTWNDKWGKASPDNQNYIDWITYDIRQIPEYKDCEYSFKDNNDFAITPKENTFTNENQNNIDILNESSQCNYNNIIPEQNNDMLQLSNILEEENITAEDPSNLYNTLILEEDFEKREKEIKQIKKKRKELNRQELLLQNEEQELLEQSGPNDNMKKKNQEPHDNMRKKYTSDELKDTDEKEPSDNMRNRKKPKTYDYNLSLPDCNKTKSKLLNIDNEGQAFFFSYLQP